MIERIKSKLSALLKSRRSHLCALALFTAAAIAGATLLDCSIHTIKIFDGEKTYTVRSLDNNIALAIEAADITSEDYEVTKTETDDKMTSVKISYGYPVYITCGDITHEITFFGGSVEEALKDAGFMPDKYDFVEPSLNTVITETTYIDYTNIDYVKSTKTEVIPHSTKKVYTTSLKEGEKKVTREGKDGVKKVTLVEKLVNGVSVETTESYKVISKPTTKKISIGKKATTTSTKGHISTLSSKKEIELDENGVPVKYKSKMKVRATAYTHTGNPCSTGVKPQPGYIAVNPKVIPYGTEMFIRTTDGKYIYGYAVAADTGGFIKRHPTGIDLFFDTKSECRNFGVRTAEIYILD